MRTQFPGGIMIKHLYVDYSSVVGWNTVDRRTVDFIVWLTKDMLLYAFQSTPYLRRQFRKLTKIHTRPVPMIILEASKTARLAKSVVYHYPLFQSLTIQTQCVMGTSNLREVVNSLELEVQQNHPGFCLSVVMACELTGDIADPDLALIKSPLVYGQKLLPAAKLKP